MAAHSSVLAWRIPGTGEPGGLPSMGSHRVGHDWSGLAAAAAAAALPWAVCVCSLLSHVQPHRQQPTRPPVHEILQARTLEWDAIPGSKRNYRRRQSEVTQSCPIPCNPMDCSPPGSSIHGIFQARVPEWVAVSFSTLSSSGLKIGPY